MIPRHLTGRYSPDRQVPVHRYSRALYRCRDRALPAAHHPYPATGYRTVYTGAAVKTHACPSVIPPESFCTIRATVALVSQFAILWRQAIGLLARWTRQVPRVPGSGCAKCGSPSGICEVIVAVIVHSLLSFLFLNLEYGNTTAANDGTHFRSFAGHPDHSLAYGANCLEHPGSLHLSRRFLAV